MASDFQVREGITPAHVIAVLRALRMVNDSVAIAADRFRDGRTGAIPQEALEEIAREATHLLLGERARHAETPRPPPRLRSVD
ncbi:hypothetical protein A3B21_00725 [Candidatus Uhrbacteria bacterium RIFCSPLOWO2_01_FULL_47_24]|uniref:Uncharacterized protein n=1 Tax=Candidatus Uhrbacteria bacterium RIFCSPLOWO2_01_FULL_47_24 TaxID=1802401 RepID=A0A1F7UNM5_9BACT|nr:MAG: hypothetical protein A2753_01360 [Candidatus Uhrbacteria bacterium RIFCSPHIGHO2_01_FULL_47_11]OGL67695.1 MAG: hypothetical protein A3D58_04615 [Candidatus Uhrbacteria bacterium RIFCSPHIGHO2_02_FULL_46_47]OGL74877.1 MAG: hypothetical protein A3F52_00380 [Candidatus Uhrbacteria bacterium RIFCSPHIGHO2_12_FULL_47_11]OGL79900.1 MAG: hypothetical protein A3B21_00725 [Candidatus Uhrbacteria bacterium RIFCSPLOWO2_01_FULL_47_24]OGL84120.1 MAG: hypothetical protein A3J03_03520 [Candidatus Uhrbact